MTKILFMLQMGSANQMLCLKGKLEPFKGRQWKVGNSELRQRKFKVNWKERNPPAIGGKSSPGVQSADLLLIMIAVL